MPYVLTWNSQSPIIHHLTTCLSTPNDKDPEKAENMSHCCFKTSQLCRLHLEAGENLSERSVPENNIKEWGQSNKLFFSNRNVSRGNSKILSTDAGALLSTALSHIASRTHLLVLGAGLRLIITSEIPKNCCFQNNIAY